MSKLFGAIEELHGQSALHRDIKAGNIMMLPTNELKLLDLGIVVATGESSLTATSVFIGSKHSAPIEQLSGEELDERTDIYAAGTVLFHSYTGRPIYHKVGPEGAIVKRMLTRPEKLEPKSEMDSRFVEFVNSCISVEAADRPNSARDCKEILLELLRPR
ncbi:MAG: protein kinase [Rhodanobacteraceae bacterium]|nr:protein kinase [Rhodanobacteraceae bacterium]